MTTPRHLLVDPENALFYHVVSRCVRRAWLCGFDQLTQTDYNHRKDWLLGRLRQLARAFPVDVYAYAIMSNHFHLVLYYDPSASMQWSDEEVVERWMLVCPPRLPDGSIDAGMRKFRKECLLAEPERVRGLRQKLGSLSFFMKLLKQPIARRANKEDGCKGHFFEQRFYSAALLSESAVLAAMAYVDLNPIRAKVAKSVRDAQHTAIYERLKSLQHPGAVHSRLQPVVSGLPGSRRLSLTLRAYVASLDALSPSSSRNTVQSRIDRWRAQVASIKRKQRVFGPERAIRSWIADRGWQMREVPLPD